MLVTVFICCLLATCSGNAFNDVERQIQEQTIHSLREESEIEQQEALEAEAQSLIARGRREVSSLRALQDRSHIYNSATSSLMSMASKARHEVALDNAKLRILKNRVDEVSSSKHIADEAIEEAKRGPGSGFSKLSKSNQLRMEGDALNEKALSLKKVAENLRDEASSLRKKASLDGVQATVEKKASSAAFAESKVYEEKTLAAVQAAIKASKGGVQAPGMDAGALSKLSTAARQSAAAITKHSARAMFLRERARDEMQEAADLLKKAAAEEKAVPSLLSLAQTKDRAADALKKESDASSEVFLKRSDVIKRVKFALEKSRELSAECAGAMKALTELRNAAADSRRKFESLQARVKFERKKAKSVSAQLEARTREARAEVKRGMEMLMRARSKVEELEDAHRKTIRIIEHLRRWVDANPHARQR